MQGGSIGGGRSAAVHEDFIGVCGLVHLFSRDATLENGETSRHVIAKIRANSPSLKVIRDRRSGVLDNVKPRLLTISTTSGVSRNGKRAASRMKSAAFATSDAH